MSGDKIIRGLNEALAFEKAHTPIGSVVDGNLTVRVAVMPNLDPSATSGQLIDVTYHNTATGGAINVQFTPSAMEKLMMVCELAVKAARTGH
jgi:hypothetical protein